MAALILNLVYNWGEASGSSFGRYAAVPTGQLCVQFKQLQICKDKLGYMVALRHSSEVRGLCSRWGHSGRPVTLVLTQPLLELITRDISWWVQAAGARG